MARELRSGKRYQQFKARIRATHAAMALPCRLCTDPINYRLQYPHPRSWSLDHILAVHEGGAVFDPRNTQPSHLHCNLSRGATEGNRKRRRRAAHKAAEATQTHTSARW